MTRRPTPPALPEFTLGPFRTAWYLMLWTYPGIWLGLKKQVPLAYLLLGTQLVIVGGPLAVVLFLAPLTTVPLGVMLVGSISVSALVLYLVQLCGVRKRGSTYYVAGDRSAILAVTATRRGWTVGNHASPRPGGRAAGDFREAVLVQLRPILDAEGIVLECTAVTARMAKVYHDQWPELVDVGRDWTGGRKMRREPIRWTEHVSRRGLRFDVPDRLPVLSSAQANRVVRLSLTVNWSAPEEGYDLGDPADRRLAYRMVMVNGDSSLIASVIHGPYLVAMWPTLRGDRDVLDQWQPLIDT